MKVVLEKLLSPSAFSHNVDVPCDLVDIADWLFALPEAEYRRYCGT